VDKGGGGGEKERERKDGKGGTGRRARVKEEPKECRKKGQCKERNDGGIRKEG
jgi:hypothetical protein